MTASDGSTADYYELPAGATQLQDLISHRNLNAQDGEMFRAIYRKGRASHSDDLRDAKKVLFYAQAEVARLAAGKLGEAWHSTAPLSDEERTHAFEADIEFQSGVIHFAGPISWRDRIHEIDVTIEALEEERAGLVQQLEDEGFRLIGKAAEVFEPVRDMSYWRNWKVGDLLECVDGAGWDSFKVGGKYPVKSLTGDHVLLETSCGNPISIIYYTADFRWHSRPSA